MASEPESDGKKLDYTSMNPIDVEMFTDIFGGSASDFNIGVPKYVNEDSYSAKGMNFWVSGFEIEPLLFL
ncbi:hypothetical protein TVAG_066000 [Trichomonas vaginalis G3]|uniref:Uncharacterized protein n=1 Tax=Trichomonas vaginalis (strain ATCC PRA-98 / G3) TaxID=412133 RepID=A2EM04_TRIV3|nr:hypothetical protein TVAGG3_0988970 [Trichomonas vaginalis G3]EAY06343.1 hypothetical protein TVAG_066000 [Trichomonas vaginalis G3]KAI5489883.1 hypothetical protein TVAGG3_0988970 [Trichomonas vaginalis G3]|eukprot:XP_001318566.1 hypothetical protein [Trichomonas vaginalis G3]